MYVPNAEDPSSEFTKVHTKILKKEKGESLLSFLLTPLGLTAGKSLA